MKIQEEAIDLFNDASVPKIIASVDVSGRPNITPKFTTRVLDDETIAFADIGGKKTKTHQNLMSTKKAALLAMKLQSKPPHKVFQIKGVVFDYQTEGKIFEEFAKKTKEMIGAPIAGVFVIRAEEVYSQT